MNIESLVKFIIDNFSKDDIQNLFALIYDSEENANLELLNISEIQIRNEQNFIDGGLAIYLERKSPTANDLRMYIEKYIKDFEIE